MPNENTKEEKRPNPSRIMEMACAFYDSCVLFTASDLGIFGFLAEKGTARCNTIAKQLKLNERGTRLLLDACVALNLLSKKEKTYSNTPETAAFLVPTSPADLSKAIRYNRDVYPAWGNLSNLARTGKPVERPELHLGDDLERTRAFVLSMHGRALGIGQSVIPCLDLKDKKTLLDVGGGPGTYSMLIAKAYPEISCTVIDLPGVVAVANELITADKMNHRVSTIPGDYHSTAFPSGNDVVVFFGVLHQEPPDSIKGLFRKAHQSLNPGGVVYVLDVMTDESHSSPPFSALFALNMSLTTENGWVFSDKELNGWLNETGFTGFTCTHLPAPMPHWLVSGYKK